MAIHTFYSTASVVVFVFCLRTGVAEIVTKPTGTEVVVGHTTYLNCSTNSPQEIHWFHIPFGSNQDRSFVYGYNQFYAPYNSGRFGIEKNQANGAYNLIIQSVKVEDAGQYECQDQNGQGKKESAQLTVLDTDPACEPRMETLQIIGSNKCGIEPGQLILSCTVKYHGNEAPIMKWSKTGDKNTISEGMTHQITDNNLIVYNLTIKGNSTVKDGDSYFCNTTRSATLNGGCKSGKIEVKGTTSEINSYIAAVICFFLIILPTAIVGTAFVLWYLHVYRPRKHEQRVENEGQEAEEETRELNTPAQVSEESSDGPDVKIKTQLQKSQERIDRRDKTRPTNEAYKAKILSLQLENDQLQDKAKHMKDEVKHLQDRVKELEQRLYAKENIDYLDKPVLAHMIQLSEKNNGKPINGITVLGNELFVVTKCCQEIAVYDSKTFQHVRDMEIIGMTDPLDIASSKDANCIYIVDRVSEETESRIMRFDTRGKILHQWPTGGRKGRLSTSGSSVIICLSDKQLINEYSSDGEVIVTVRLSPASKLNNPLHAIKVTSTCFVVSHGDFYDELHRVCVVDLEGNIKNECTKLEKSKDTSRVTMKVPICLVEDSERSIIVADLDNKRILLLSSMLNYQRKLIEKENGLKDYPVRLCFDDIQSRLFVAVNKYNSNQKEWKSGRILIYNVK